MADIPVTPPVTTPAPVAPASSSVAVVEASINNVPPNIQQLARQLELSGTLTQPPTANSIVLNTIMGQLTFILPQLAAAQRDKLLQQLLAIFQNNRPLTIVMQPGNPPAQAFLLLPPVTAQPQNPPSVGVRTTQRAGALSAPPLLPNVILSAVVLPRLNPESLSSPSPNIPFPSSPSFNPDSLATAIRGQLAGAAFNTPPSPQTPAPGMPVEPELPILPSLAPEKFMVQEALSKLEGKTLPSILPQQSGTMPSYQAQLRNMDIPFSPSSFATTPRTPDFYSSPTSPLSLRPGMEVSLRVVAILTPSVQNPVPPASNQILATVISNGPGGQPILKTDDAMLYIRQPADIPPGTQLILAVEPGKSEMAPVALPDLQQFSSLQQVLSALAQLDPAMARQLVESHLPQPGAALPGALLFFLSAIRQGDIRNWLGSGAVDLLNRNGKFDLIGKLTREFQQAGQTVRDAVVGEWRSYPMPIHDHNQFHIINLYVHRDPQHAPEKDDPTARRGADQIRFLIDMRMSRLGAIQLDGFVRRRQLDIIVRSEQALPADLLDELKRSYTQTLGAIDYAGSINFQSGRQSWLNIQKPVAQPGMVT